MIKTIPEIIDALGGNANVARILGCTPAGVSEMRRRRSIPLKWWIDLLASDEAKAAKLTPDTLLKASQNGEL